MWLGGTWGAWKEWGHLKGLGGPGGRAETLPGRFWCDPRNFAQVEQVVDAAQILPTPCPRPGFWPSFDPRKKTWVENRPEMLGSSRFWPEERLFRPPQFCLGRAESGPGQIWPDPGAWPSLAQDRCGPGPKLGTPKSVTQRNNHFFTRFRRVPQRDMHGMVLTKVLAYIFAPKPNLKKSIPGISHFSRFLPGPPLGLCGLPYSPCGSPRRSYSLFCHPQPCSGTPRKSLIF